MIEVLAHRRILLNILKDLFQDRTLASWLGFKGGTCLYLFHELPRFSVDLDFNLLPPPSKNEENFDAAALENILKQYMTVKNHSTFFWLGSYQKTHHKVKVEISRREYPDEYELRDLYGIAVKCMTKPYLFAHKLCAISDRNALVNRDLFDAHFMFQKQFPIAEEIITLRTGMTVKEYFKTLIEYIPKNIPHPNSLQGLGELISPEQKSWVKKHLIEELLFHLKSYSP